MVSSYLIAYSGGLDSHVLLNLMAELKRTQPISVRAIHIHHGLSPNANHWAAHCEQTCKALGVDFIQRRAVVDRSAGNVEENARDARYQLFAEELQENEILMTAHHQDDQAETLLLQLMRGAGPKGLAAMPEIKSFAKGWHARPLLNMSRDELKAYAEGMGLNWIEDESNANQTFSRNFIRHQVMPLLKTHWPAAGAVMSRSATHCAEAQALLEKYALSDYQKMKGSRPGTLSVKSVLSLSSEKQRLILRTWIADQGFGLPDSKKLVSIQQTVLTAAPDRMPKVVWGRVQVRRYRDDLYCHSEDPSSQKTRPRMSQRLYIPQRGNLSLKNLFQEWGVPPWERDKIPLIYEGDKLVGVVGYYEPPAA